MAEAVVSLVLETITKLLIEEKKFLSGVSDEAEKLRSELRMMQAFLRDADQKQHDQARVKACVSECRDLAYEAENVLEDYAFRLSSRRGKHGISSMAKRFACILNECFIVHNVGVEIQGLNTRISTLTQQFQNYGIIKALTPGEGSSSDARQQQSRVTYSFVANDEDIVGIEEDIKKLVEVLVEKGTQVVSIIGMGGCGKTTLARKVYNHPHVKSRFNGFAWVCVSQQWQTRKIFQEILAGFDLPDLKGINKISDLTENQMVEKLVRFQETKKCLVVLDDVWEDDVWKCIQPAFSHNCKILVTTRKETVAMQIGPSGYHHRPRLLNDDESLELLLKKAFGNPPDPELEDIEGLKRLGKEMVKSCRGLPLAVIVLGGILASRKKLFEWEAVSKDVRFQKSVGESEVVQGILGLSYNDLPYHLKPCFLYLSVLAEDERMDGDELYNLWIAEGMVLAKDRKGSDESIKEVAGRYLGELVKRCIVMVEPRWSWSPSCYLHDLMKDMCRAKAREENFAKVLDYGSGSDDVEIENSIPRVMINSPSPENVLKFNVVCTSLRALRFRSKQPVDLMVQVKGLGISNFVMLRSLIIEGVMDPVVEMFKDGNQKAKDDGVFELPVGKLIHLRQLSLRSCELVMSPSSISSLEHLEILDLDDSVVMWTKKQEIMTRRLRHLVLPRDIVIGKVPAQIICVPDDLEVINGQIPNCRLRIKNLSHLTNVRELIRPSYFEDYHEVEVVEDLFKCISKSHHLKQVGFWDRTEKLFCQEKGSVLVQILLSSKVNAILVGGSFCSTLPDYDSHFARNLTVLDLDSTKIKEDPMKLLEVFPQLQKLYLFTDAFTGKEMVCHSMGFPQLRILTLGFLYSLETWTVERGAMPNLYHLVIYKCERLKLIPEEVSSIPTLKILEIKRMPREFIEENVVKFRHVPSIITESYE